MFSFAKKPDSVATTAFQFPNPNGAKTGEIILPICAKKEFSCETILTAPFKKPKFKRNQIKMLARNIMLPAFEMKDFTFKTAYFKTFFKLGLIYSPSSIIK